MANTIPIIHKRTSVSGRLPEATNTASSRYIRPGELSINLTDQKVHSSNGNVIFEVGANLETSYITTIYANTIWGKTDNLALRANGDINILSNVYSQLHFNANTLVDVYYANGSSWVYAGSDTAGLEVYSNTGGLKSAFYLNGSNAQIVSNGYQFNYSSNGLFSADSISTNTATINAIYANGSLGDAGYRLTSNGSGLYWSDERGFTGSVGFTGSQGETGLGFKIAKKYSSVAALLADTSPTGIVAGEFALIDTMDVEDPENSRLYLWDGSVYSYVNDLSGAAGIIGPQGDLGYTGSQGVIGYTGSVGFVGSRGYTGSKGTTYVGSTAPVDPVNGDTWWNSENGIRYVYYVDSNSSQWVQESAVGPIGVTGYTGSATDFTNIGSNVIPSSNVTYDIGSAANQWKNLWIANTTTIARVQERFVGLTNANGTFTHDCSNGQLFNHTSIANNFIANFTNLNLANNHATTLTLILNQGGTAYVANAIQIDGNAQTVNWQGNTSPPTGNANKKDIMSFSIINASNTYTVFGQLVTFG